MKHKYERVYVKVNANFDSTGYMQPRSIMWSDGRVFNIDKVAVSISTFTVSIIKKLIFLNFCGKIYLIIMYFCRNG